ncbi:AGC/PKA protein kinase [Colletotrichum scovillei]|uniref:AGC/PKA protein kinase n=1 Tax=Colletotrichum scovillei TaxID=1209932 RepID=A0A9P7QSV3_9PEZI|nr:AGC/PKA protein kinase [Colletotrichum scovillei]KAG7042289.1 AGC/PKA protein kinase [Colletotrichum scovillei]KAG7062321.1 AGC/PKA protein kinase [Colletotrichum scovillei]
MEVAGLVIGAFGVLPLAKECLQLVNKHIGPSKHNTTELERLSGWLDDIIQTIAILHPLLKSVDAGGQPLHAIHTEGFVIQETKQYLEQIGKTMDEVHGTLGELGQAVENLRDDSRSTAEGIRDQLQRKAEAEDRRVVLDWVSTRTFVLEQTDLLNLRYEGTGTWFLECRNFKTWSSYTGSEERYRILFCLGGMGAGKTIITATVVDYLRSKYRGRSDIALAYVYCDYKNRSLDTSATLLRSILRQIVEALPSSPTEFNKMHERKDPLPSTVVKKLLRDTIKMIPSCIIVIDAIDELEVFVSNERASMLDIIDDLRRQPNVKLFLTSRPISTISYQFKPTNSLIQEVRAEIQDLETYLGQRIQKLSPLLRRHLELQKKVKDAIIGIVDGMFLLAHLFVDTFRDDLTVAAVNRRLTELQRDAHIAQSTPNSGDDWKHRLLCKAYDNVLDRIKTQEHDSVAMKALMWITYAKRPLKVPELVEAIAAGLHHERLAKDNMYEREDIVPACGGLVVVDETSGVVRLSHYSAQEYFEKTCFPEAHYEISGVCAAYLILYERPDCQSGLGPSSFNRPTNEPLTKGAMTIYTGWKTWQNFWNTPEITGLSMFTNPKPQCSMEKFRSYSQ